MVTSDWRARLLSFALPLLGICAPLYLQYVLYSGSPAASQLAFDTVNTYIPLAKRFLQEGSALFADPEHLMVAPGSFLYMALLGADVGRVVQANLVLSALALLLAADAVRRVGGPVAAYAAAWLIACSPLLPEVQVPALSEPPHLFFVVLWLWSASLIWSGYRHWSLILLGALALFAAIMVRATYLYWMPAAIGASALLLFAASQRLRQSARAILLLHLMALGLTAAWCAQNYYKFGEPIIATGSGAALYFGSNAALAGYEPPYYGMLHDHWIIAGDHSHLSIEGDRRLKRAAVEMLRDMPPETFAGMVLQKLGATLFFSHVTLAEGSLNERSWRISLLLLALVGLWGSRRSPWLWMLGCILLYNLAILSLVMHSSRYSIGAIEVSLTLAAALGVAWLLRLPFSPVRPIVFLLVAAVCVALGVYDQRTSPPLMPMLEKGRSQVAQQIEAGSFSTEGFVGDPLSREGGAVQGEGVIAWRQLTFERIGGVPVLSFRLTQLGADCTNLTLTYSAPGHPSRQQSIPLQGLQLPQQMNIGTLYVNVLDPKDAAAELRIAFACPSGGQVALENLQIRYLTTAHYYRKRLAADP